MLPVVDPATAGRAVVLTWSFDPAVVVSLLIAAAAYTVGTTRLWRRAGTGHGVTRAQVAAFALGWLVLAVALVSPIHELGEALFAAHMVQHELLMVVAAPLLVVGRPLVPFLWAVPMPWRRALGSVARNRVAARSWHALSAPVMATAIQAIVLWGWHVPAFYDAAVGNDVVHAAEHVLLLGSALLFWWALIVRSTGRPARGRSIVLVVVTAAQTGVLGALLTFASRPLYPAYAASPVRPWGLTALGDQQLAGLIMWIPGGLTYLVAALGFMALWLREPGTRWEERSRYESRPLPLTTLRVENHA